MSLRFWWMRQKAASPPKRESSYPIGSNNQLTAGWLEWGVMNESINPPFFTSASEWVPQANRTLLLRLVAWKKISYRKQGLSLYRNIGLIFKCGFWKKKKWWIGLRLGVIFPSSVASNRAMRKSNFGASLFRGYGSKMFGGFPRKQASKKDLIGSCF